MKPESAIIRQAKRDWRYFQEAIVASEEQTGALLKEYKESGVWKEHYKTWTDACVPLNISRRQADQLIADEVAIRRESPNEVHKEDEKALRRVEAFRLEEPPEVPPWEQEDKPHIKTADEAFTRNGDIPKRTELIPWASKMMTLIDGMPFNQIHNKLESVDFKRFQSAVAELQAVLSPLLAEPPKEMCHCGCGLSAAMTQVLARAGVPCMGLTPQQAGLIISKLEGNEWKLPEAWAFCKNSGEWIERRFKGKKPAKL